jgi:hypothetical protein
MNVRYFRLALLLGILLVTIVFALIPLAVRAQTCGIPGAPPCPPPAGGGGGGGKKRPTAIPRSPTPTATPTETPTATPTARPTPCDRPKSGDNLYANCPTPLPCISISTAGNGRCTPTPSPASGAGSSGPTSPFLGLGVLGLIIVVCFGGLLISPWGRGFLGNFINWGDKSPGPSGDSSLPGVQDEATSHFGKFDKEYLDGNAPAKFEKEYKAPGPAGDSSVPGVQDEATSHFGKFDKEYLDGDALDKFKKDV